MWFENRKSKLKSGAKLKVKLKITAVFYFVVAFAIFAHLQTVNVFAQQTKHGKKGNVKKPKVIELKSARGTVGQNEKDPNIKTENFYSHGKSYDTGESYSQQKDERGLMDYIANQ